MTFDKWWNEKYGGADWSTGVLEAAFKEMAFSAWKAGIASQNTRKGVSCNHKFGKWGENTAADFDKRYKECMDSGCYGLLRK